VSGTFKIKIYSLLHSTSAPRLLTMPDNFQ
jgi:hypothetical protein